MRNERIKTPKTRSVTHQQLWLLSPHVYNILCYTKSTLKIKTACHFVQYLISYITALPALTQQPQQYWGSSFPELTDHIPLSVSHEGQKQGCEKNLNKKPQWCLHYLLAPWPVNEARVNCCWLDVSTHGWVSLQISLRGPQMEKRKDEVAHRQWCEISVKCSSSVGLAGRETDKECRWGNM